MEISALYQLFADRPVCTDTRKITKGCLFFALQGANFNGNAFASQALEQGADYAIVTDSSLQGDRYIWVENTLDCLQQLATYHRQHFAIPVIAITGSNGKTTTKELLNEVLSKKYTVLATKGNLNNHIGVPLTLLELKDEHEIAIIEMGANHIGEIRALCEIALPTHGLITNIGRAHLEGFGSVEGVQKAKGELYQYLHEHEGFAFVNADDQRLTNIADTLQYKLTYGLDPELQTQVQLSYHENPDTSFTLRHEKNIITSKLYGSYNAINMAAAYAVGKHFKVDDHEIVSALSDFVSTSNRSETLELHQCFIIKDAYNANPSSMELAVRAFGKKYPNGIVVLGDMKELGGSSLSLHRELIEVADSFSFEKIYLVGPEFKQAINSYASANHSIHTANTVEELQSEWDWKNFSGKALLLKGSRSMHLEKLLESGI